MKDMILHVNWSFLLEDLAGISRLVVESDIRADLLEERDFLFGASRRNDF